MSGLSILCVTRGEKCVLPLLISMSESARDLDCDLWIAADGPDTYALLRDIEDLREPWCHIISVESQGYIESVLDEALSHILTPQDGYILRLDDDEQISQGMYDWLAAGEYRSSPHWKFPRAHAWGDGWQNYQLESSDLSCIINPPLWPDHQTRLSRREMSGGRTIIHCGSPFGGGEIAPCLIEHHKFVIKTLEQRREIVARYDRVQPGMGEGFRVFSTPEDVISPVDIQTYTLANLEIVCGLP